MIPLHGVKPRLGNPFKTQFGIRAAVDQIADAKKSVNRWVKADTVKSDLQRFETSMDIADGEIAADSVALEVFDEVHANTTQQQRKTPNHRNPVSVTP
jgi:hypothetical protein